MSHLNGKDVVRQSKRTLGPVIGKARWRARDDQLQSCQTIRNINDVAIQNHNGGKIVNKLNRPVCSFGVAIVFLARGHHHPNKKCSLDTLLIRQIALDRSQKSGS